MPSCDANTVIDTTGSLVDPVVVMSTGRGWPVKSRWNTGKKPEKKHRGVSDFQNS